MSNLITRVAVARFARQIENHSSPWLARKLLGLNPKELVHLLRKLLAETEWTREALAVATVTARDATNKLKWFRHETTTMVWRLDRLIDDFGTKRQGVIVMTPAQFQRLDMEYACPDRERTRAGDRWAYTYRKYPVWTAQGITGPFIVTQKVFEAFLRALAQPAKLIEK